MSLNTNVRIALLAAAIEKHIDKTTDFEKRAYQAFEAAFNEYSAYNPHSNVVFFIALKALADTAPTDSEREHINFESDLLKALSSTRTDLSSLPEEPPGYTGLGLLGMWGAFHTEKTKAIENETDEA